MSHAPMSAGSASLLSLALALAWPGCSDGRDPSGGEDDPGGAPWDMGTEPTRPGPSSSDASLGLPVTDASAGDAAEPPLPDGTQAPGCGERRGATGDQTLVIDSGGLSRSYLLHVPESYDPAEPGMLVIGFHGFGSSGAQQAAVSKMSAVADEEGFLALYPNGQSSAWNGGTCCPGAAPDDVQFVRDMVAAISEDYCVDPKRIYATGISNGGLFANRVACEASDLIAAAAPVASGVGVACQPSRPVAHLTFAGTADPFVPYAIQQAEGETWRRINGCSSDSSVVYAQGDAACEEWAACEAGAAVRFCTIQDGGHTWPGGVPIPIGKTSMDIDASREMVAFFDRHPMP